MTTPPTNVQIAELLGQRGDVTEGPRQRAYYRSSAAAFVWPEEAADVHASGRPLTEMRYVGDRLAARIAGWIEDPPEVPESPPQRSGFLSLTQVMAELDRAPEWRSDLRGDLQMHTKYSDGLSTVDEMAEAAAARDYDYIAITDHSVGQRVPAGMDEKAIAAQWDEIDRFNASGPIRILRSIEMNLYSEGRGAMEADSLTGFELVLGSFHSQLRVPENQTDRYLAALRNPNVDIIGHPRGRMFNRRGGLHADWEKVFELALELDKALEINANPARQDLQVDLLEPAAGMGVRLSIGTDSHSIPELDFVVFSLGAALKAGVKRDQILNFLPAEEVLEWRAGHR
jgi:histidinol phosphatase-like PHP family hydrolase